MTKLIHIAALARWLVAMTSFAIWLTGCATTPKPTEKQLLLWPPPPELPRYKYETTVYSSANVTVLPEEVRFRMLMTGQQLPNIGMEKPYGVAVSDGRMYVTDTAIKSVHVFDFVRKTYFRIGFRFEGKLQKPLGIATDGRGFVYVADVEQRRVVVYDTFGLYQRSVGSKELLDRPVAVAVDSKNDRIYVLDAGGIDSNRHQVVVFNLSGEFLHTFGERGAETGKFNLPLDIAVGPEGEIYVLDSGNFRVQVFDTEGRFLRAWGGVGTAFGHFARPRSIAVDSDGTVLVTDTQFGNFQIFDSTGTLLLYIGNNAPADGPMKFALVAGITTGERGLVFVVDQGFKKVEILRKLNQDEAQQLINRGSDISSQK